MPQLKRINIYRGGPHSWNPKHIHHHRIMTQAEAEPNVVSMIDDLLQEFESAADVDLFIDQFWEPIQDDMLADIAFFVQTIKQLRPNWRLFLQLNIHSKHHEEYFKSLPLDGVIVLDFFLYQVVRQTIGTKANPINIRGFNTFQDPKFLFLTGRAHKPHRIRLLKRFVDSGLIEKSVWSFFYHNQSTFYNSSVRTQLPELNDEEFLNFVTTWHNNPDQIDQTIGPYGTQYDGFPYGIKMYADTDFSVISETNFDITDNPWMTEKTWRPIINCHPFILAGDSGSYKRLRDMGFETYESLLSVPRFYEIPNVEERLDAIVKNVQCWINTLSTHSDFVNEAMIHNKKTLIHLYQVAYNAIMKFIYQHGLQEHGIDIVFPTLSGRTNKQKSIDWFVDFYNNIKDPSWPECQNEGDFYNLPKIIQEECIGFGYTPTK